MSRRLRDLYHFDVQPISPVHVGDGNTIGEESLYPVTGGRDECVYVLDMERILDEHESDSNPGTYSSLASLVARIAGRAPARYALHEIRDRNFRPHEIRLQMRSGAGHPMIPGSSLKGAIRTAVFGDAIRLAKRSSEQTTRQRDVLRQLTGLLRSPNSADTLERALFRDHKGQPYDDIFRCLCVSDACFPVSSLTLAEVRTLSPNQRDLRAEKFRQHVEALRPTARAKISISLDRHLLDSRFRELGGDLTNLQGLKGILRRQAKALLTEEIRYFERAQRDDVARALDDLRLQFDSDPAVIPLRLGWGTGWTTMTGAVHDEQARGQLRSVGAVGRRNGPYPRGFEAPKTRKLVRLLTQPQAIPVLGWILLRESLDDTLDIGPPVGRSRRIASTPQLGDTIPDALMQLETMGIAEFAPKIANLVEAMVAKSQVHRQAFAKKALDLVARSSTKNRKKWAEKNWYKTLQRWLSGE